MTKTEKSQTDWIPEPFPEPRTIPAGWNASALSKKKEAPKQETPEDDWKPEPFPEPRMFPWDSHH